jgi:hypothetical protein
VLGPFAARSCPVKTQDAFDLTGGRMTWQPK